MKKEMLKELMDKLDYGSLSYVEEHQTIESDSHRIKRFQFDFWRRRFYLITVDHDPLISNNRKGKIPASAVKNFLEAVSDYCDLPDSEYFDKNNPDKRSVWHRAEMFNKHFTWYTAEEPLFEKLEQAFRDLISSLKFETL
jgi:hypothetical protein